MTLLNALLRSYEYSEGIGLVDNHKENEPVLLPIYHNSMRSDGKNIIIAKLNKDGSLFKAEYLNKDKVIVFPITEDSVARSGKNPPSHPLVDKIDYIQSSNSVANRMYKEAFQDWFYYNNSKDVNTFLEIINKFINNESMLLDITNSIYETQNPILNKFEVEYTETINDKKTQKKVDLSKVFLTFEIIEFNDKKKC